MVFRGRQHPHDGPDPEQFEWTPTDPATVTVGDTVYLKTGGPAMTVTSVDGGETHVVWFATHTEELRDAVLPAEVLVTATRRT